MLHTQHTTPFYSLLCVGFCLLRWFLTLGQRESSEWDLVGGHDRLVAFLGHWCGNYPLVWSLFEGSEALGALQWVKKANFATLEGRDSKTVSLRSFQRNFPPVGSNFEESKASNVLRKQIRLQLKAGVIQLSSREVSKAICHPLGGHLRAQKLRACENAMKTSSVSCFKAPKVRG